MERPDVPQIPSNFEPSIDFKGLMDKATAMLPDDLMSDGPPAPPETPPVSADPVPSIQSVRDKVEAVDKTVEATPEVTPEATPVTEAKAEVREFQDTDLVKVKVDGQEQVIPYKEYREGIQREAVFTKRMQTLAQQREQAEQALANQYAQLYQAAQELAWQKQQMEKNDPIAKLAQRLESEKSPDKDPNTLATIGEIQQALSEHRQQVANEFARREQAQKQQLAEAASALKAQSKQQADANRFTAALNETLSNKDFAQIRTAVPSPELADAIIRYKVAGMGPQTIEEGIEFMQVVVKDWANSIKTQQKQDHGRTEAIKAQAVIEPPAGSAPPPRTAPPARSFFNLKDNTMDWNALRERALATLEK